MELLESALSRLNVSTCDLTAKDIQEVLVAVKKNNIRNDKTEYYYNIIVEKLWYHLTTEINEFDDQLLCSTCFYSLLSTTTNEKFYLDNILQIIINDNQFKTSDDRQVKLSLSVPLSYGIFQSSYLLQPITNNETLQKMLIAIFQLLLQLGYEYSQYTFIAFKIMVSFKKVIDTEFQDVIFNKNNQIKLLNIINHNWENPIPGVRSHVRMLFQTLLLVLDNTMYEQVLKEIKSFYWNKAKFLMLTEVIEHFKGKIEDLVLSDWIEGLVYSLFKPGLVSAGADMYNAILKKSNSDVTWKSIFLPKVMEILCGSSFKAIGNFSNYWCLNTLQKFPMLMHLLIDSLNNLKTTDFTEYKLYSTICIMKHGNKLGLIKRSWNSSNCKENQQVPSSMEHRDPSIRMSGFEIMCVTPGKYLPTEFEYNQILTYLQNNVNSDCRVLRITMINNLSIFLSQLHIVYINNIQLHASQDILNIKIFCQYLQQFVIESLELDGNYQRKITSIKIGHNILKCFNNVPRKKHQQTRNTNKLLIFYLKESGNWLFSSDEFIMKLIGLLKDPANDVQDGALQLLSEYYSKELSDSKMIDHLIEEGLKCLESKFFYEINCGLIMFKLITNIIFVNNNIDCRFKTIEDIYEFAFNEITIEYNLKRNIVHSIKKGKQLHSFLNLLFLIFEASIKYSYELNVPRDKIFSLLDMVEHISNQFDWEDESQTSSDFSKINDMVQSLIKNSGFELAVADDGTKISGLHQIVLNCLWLNVKASCDLASILIQMYRHDQSICKKCLNIITHVLETSRHKGAIEAAGSALGLGINILTSSKYPDVSNLSLSLLKEKLKDLLFETTKMSSVTRRGAGLSIMVHRIVSNDLKKGKPLFHYFMKTLLDICSSSEDSKDDIGNEKDLPEAIYIHFLTRIVTDSSLASDMMYYSAQLAALAFDNLTNTHWQIRNAALQLYGALIPKFIGQKKAPGTDDETIATVACDEFRTHSPKLWVYINKQIENQNHNDIIESHSNLIPILNVLSSTARRYNFSYDLKEQEKCELSLLSHLLNLLGSPIYTVRRLTSQCITNMYSFDTIYEAITHCTEYNSENYLHGIILLISSCFRIYCKTSQDLLDNLIEKFQNILMLKKHSYISKWNLEKLIPSQGSHTLNEIEAVLHEAKTNRYEPGVSLWASLKIQNCLQHIQWNLIPESLKLLFASVDFEKYCETLINRIQNSIKPLEEAVLTEIAKVLVLSNMIGQSSAACKLLYYISLKTCLNIETFDNSLITQLVNHPSYKLRFIIPFASRFFAQSNTDNLLQVSEIIFMLCNPERNDVEMRHIAAMSNNELAYSFKSYSDPIKINSIKSAIISLQDEDEDIRNLSVFYYKSILKESQPKQPYICLKEILKKEFLFSILQNPELSIQKICKDLFDMFDSASIGKNDVYNPFANDAKNIYLEVNVLRKSLEELCETSF